MKKQYKNEDVSIFKNALLLFKQSLTMAFVKYILYLR